MNCDNCVCCGSKNIEKVGVNTRVELIYPDVRRLGAVTQRVITPSDALVCKECGHVEFFIDVSKLNRSM